jgi:Putative endonuclease, protein of unknown function (DUF1780)
LATRSACARRFTGRFVAQANETCDTVSVVTNEELKALWLDDLREQAADTVGLLSNPRKQERERRTCAAFLRCAGISFTEDGVQASSVEPPDVCFESARFEITMNVDHEMHREWKERNKRRAEASGIEELLEPYHPPAILSRQQVADLIVEISKKKARKYSARGPLCATLDLLVYINQNVGMNVDSPTPTCDVLLSHGWRSVSILIPPYSYVVLAASGAPGFLLEQVEKPRAAWSSGQLGLSGLFDI